MKRNIIYYGIVTATLALAIGLYSSYMNMNNALKNNNNEEISLQTSFDATLDIDQRTEHAENLGVELVKDGQAAVLMDVTTGSILYSKNHTEKRAPASVTKVMAMYLILEAIESGALEWDDILTISESAAGMGGSQIFLETGEQMSVEDLFKGVAMASGNDATVALAEAVSGTEETFVIEMNKRAKEWGLENTNFTNPTGLPDDNHYTSAYDIAIMSYKLLKDYGETVTKFTSVYEDYLRQGTEDEFWLVNTNKLIRFEPGVDGLKTGYTQEAGYCLTATKKQGDMRVIGVILGASSSANRNAEMKDLLNFSFAQFELKEYVPSDEVVYEKTDIRLKDDKLKVVTGEPLHVLLKKGESMDAYTKEVKLFSTDGSLEKGEVVGEYIIYKDGEFYRSVPLVTANESKIVNPFQMFFKFFKEVMS